MANEKAEGIQSDCPTYTVVKKEDDIEDIIRSLTEIYTKLDAIWVLSDQPEIDNICGQIGIDCLHAIVEIKKLGGRI